ncbi:MAG: intermembrane transport protein PqiB [Shewanella sp.]
MNLDKQMDADIKPVRGISAIWFVPIVALLIGVWMVYYHLSHQGPAITIYFDSAEGMEAGKTKIKSRYVNIGEVESIRLNEEGDGVNVTARLAKSAEKMLVEDTNFWVVTPKITLAGVSGLDTLISGVYIELAPGASKKSADTYTALESAPITPKGTPGLHLTLNSNKEFDYAKGDPIIYKGLTVGQIDDVFFNIEQRVVYYNAFINAPYHELITSNTRFWDASGLTVSLNAEGISVNTGNVETMLTNGVTFDVPDGMPLGDKITERTDFDIYQDYLSASNARYTQSLPYVMLVNDSIRGLNVGAPVEYRGVQIGQVTAVNLGSVDPKALYNDAISIPVLINLNPGRVGLPDTQQGAEIMNEQNINWVKSGLRASLKTGNVLTGSLFVDLQHFDLPKLKEIASYKGYAVIPTVKNEFSQITDKFGQLVDKINRLPINDMATNANATLTNANTTLANASALLVDLQRSTNSLDKLLTAADQQQLIQELTATLENISRLSGDFSQGSTGYEQLQQGIQSISDVMYELKPLLEQLKHQPNGLIFDSGTEHLEPKKHPEVTQ